MKLVQKVTFDYFYPAEKLGFYPVMHYCWTEIILYSGVNAMVHYIMYPKFYIAFSLFIFVCCHHIIPFMII